VAGRWQFSGSNRVEKTLLQSIWASAIRCARRRCRGLSGCSSGVEHNLAKVRVERSNRFTRSNTSGYPPDVQKGHGSPWPFCFLGPVCLGRREKRLPLTCISDNSAQAGWCPTKLPSPLPRGPSRNADRQFCILWGSLRASLSATCCKPHDHHPEVPGAAGHRRRVQMAPCVRRSCPGGKPGDSGVFLDPPSRLRLGEAPQDDGESRVSGGGFPPHGEHGGRPVESLSNSCNRSGLAP
jgi:hypothetical protein